MDLNNIQTEIDASYLYKQLSIVEKDSNVAQVFAQMSDIEMSHAVAFARKFNLNVDQLPKPSGRAKILNKIGEIIGYDYVLGVLLDTEKSISSAVQHARKNTNAHSSLSDTAHVTILKYIFNNHKHISSDNVVRFVKKHRSVGGNALRLSLLLISVPLCSY